MGLTLSCSLFQAIDHDGSAIEIDSKVDTLQLALEIFTSKPSSPALAHTVQQAHKILSGLFREEERRRQARAAKALLRAAAGPAAQGDEEEEDDQGTFADVLHRIARSLDADSAPHRGTPPPTRNLPSSKKAGTAGGAAAPIPVSFLPGASGSTALFAGAGALDVPVLDAPDALTASSGAATALGLGGTGAYPAQSPSASLSGLATSLAPAASPLPPVPSSLTPDASWPYATAFDATDGVLDFGLGAFGFTGGDPFGLGLGRDDADLTELLPAEDGLSGGGGTGGFDAFGAAEGSGASWDLGGSTTAQQGQPSVGMTDAEAAAAYWNNGGAGERRGSGW